MIKLNYGQHIWVRRTTKERFIEFLFPIESKDSNEYKAIYKLISMVTKSYDNSIEFYLNTALKRNGYFSIQFTTWPDKLPRLVKGIKNKEWMKSNFSRFYKGPIFGYRTVLNKNHPYYTGEIWDKDLYEILHKKDIFIDEL